MTILIRAECNYTTGSGHLMRALSLSQELSRRIDSDILFVLNNTPGHFRELVENSGYRCVDLQAVAQYDEKNKMKQLLEKEKPKIAITDSYEIDAIYLKMIKRSCNALLVCISDFADIDYSVADMIINHNIYGAQLDYRAGRDAMLLKGERYAILRDEFLEGKARAIPEKNPKALVTFGGSDFQNLSLKAAKTLSRAGIPTTLVVGAMHRHVNAIKKMESGPMRVLRDVRSMSGLMWDADFALASAGTTTYELFATELPCAFYKIADNQGLICDAVEKRGLAIFAGEGAETTEEDMEETVEQLLQPGTRKALYNNVRGLIDGKGKERIVDELLKLV